jgi:hypothetical protein
MIVMTWLATSENPVSERVCDLSLVRLTSTKHTRCSASRRPDDSTPLLQLFIGPRLPLPE